MRYLLKKVKYFQTNLTEFRRRVELLDSMVERQLPRVHDHLRKLDLNIEYFATRWLIPLLSYDTSL